MSISKKTWRRRVGRVTVYQRGGRFWIYYRDYRPVRRPVGTSREEALALAAKINAQLAEGAPTMLAFQPIAVTAMIAKWLDHHEHVRRSAVNTVNRYRAAIEHLKRFIEADHPGLRADRFDGSMAEQYVRHLRTAKVSPNVPCRYALNRRTRSRLGTHSGFDRPRSSCVIPKTRRKRSCSQACLEGSFWRELVHRHFTGEGRYSWIRALPA